MTSLRESEDKSRRSGMTNLKGSKWETGLGHEEEK